MAPSDAVGTSDTQPSPGRKLTPSGLIGGIAGFLLGRIAPGAVLVPAAFVMLATWLLGKYGSPARKRYSLAVALLIGQAGWILVGFLLLHTVTVAVLIFVANVIAAVHIYRSPSKQAVYGWATAQGMLALNYFLPLLAIHDKVVAVGYIVHVTLCVLTITQLIGAYRAVTASVAIPAPR